MGSTALEYIIMNEKIDRKSPAILAALAQAPIYKKQGRVQARRVTEREEVTTTLASGSNETKNVANPGDYIVTNPSGERYVIGPEKFEKRYEATDEDGVYAAKGYCRAIVNPFGKPIVILASWGELQYGDVDCLIADTCDANGALDGEPYLIENAAFGETYAEERKAA